MPLFSKAFGINKSQPELDFVNIPLHTDIWLFIDPFAISQRVDPWSQECHRTLFSYFQHIVDFIRAGRLNEARALLLCLREPNEIRFGLSMKRPAGAGIGLYQAQQLFEALRDSQAVKTGFLSSLEECELMIEGIGRDKISDLTTNVIRAHLIAYTQQQCGLLNVTLQQVPMAPCFDAQTMQWESGYHQVPVWKGKPVVLVPKAIARYSTAYDHQKYYDHFVLNYLRQEALDASSSLVNVLKNGKRVVYKKDLKRQFPCTKEFLYNFSREHREILADYRSELVLLEKTGRAGPVSEEDERVISEALAAALTSISAGNAKAAEYHSLMIGIVEFIFFPNLLSPKKEREIHQGRKRIDILMENGARDGIFHRLHDIRKLPCAFVPIECKNYTTEVANPELDQLGGRFSVNRGMFGFLCCRTFENRKLFVERCRDSHKDGRGLIVPLDDTTVLKLLTLVRSNHRQEIDAEITNLVNEVWVS
jgi:hypothetical protein